MNSTELRAAAEQIRASQHPAAHEIADLLDDTATLLAIREQIWTACEYTPAVQALLTENLWGREIAIAKTLTEGAT